MLPELPIKHKRKEAEFGLKFRELFFTQEMPDGDYELKDTRGKNSFNLKEITEEQIDSGLRTESKKGNLTRIISGTSGSADYIFRKNSNSFFVIHYPKGMAIINIKNILLEKTKSLTWERAQILSLKH